MHDIVNIGSLNLNLYLYFMQAYLQSEVEYDGQLNINLEHALEDEVEPIFASRGSVEVKSLRSGYVDVDQEDLTQEDITKIQVI